MITPIERHAQARVLLTGYVGEQPDDPALGQTWLRALDMIRRVIGTPFAIGFNELGTFEVNGTPFPGIGNQPKGS